MRDEISPSPLNRFKTVRVNWDKFIINTTGIRATYLSVHFNMMQYIEYFTFLNLILLFVTVDGKHVIENVSFNRTSDAINALEVPDSPLFLLDNLKLRKIDISHYGKQSQQTSNSTTDSRRCSCKLGVCKCCTGFFMDLINQKACMKVTYDPGDFAFDVAMTLNDRVLIENSMSGKNPRPLCISPPRFSNLKLCAKFYNVFFPGRNFHFCLSMTGTWRSFQLYNFVFDCLRMGANGIVMLGPEENGGISVPNPQGGVDAVVDSGDDDIEDYDETNIVKSLLDIFEK